MFWSTNSGASGGDDDTAIFNSVNPANLGAKFSWSSGPNVSGISTINFGPVAADVRRTPSTDVNSRYILQFDRGFGGGELIIRPWDNNVEGGAVYRHNDRDVIPHKNSDPDWWVQ